MCVLVEIGHDWTRRRDLGGNVGEGKSRSHPFSPTSQPSSPRSSRLYAYPPSQLVTLAACSTLNLQVYMLNRTPLYSASQPDPELAGTTDASPLDLVELCCALRPALFAPRSSLP